MADFSDIPVGGVNLSKSQSVAKIMALRKELRAESKAL